LYLALVQNRLTVEQKTRLILPHHALHASAITLQWYGREQTFRARPEALFEQFAGLNSAGDNGILQG
jgi:hypothetical protein